MRPTNDKARPARRRRHVNPVVFEGGPWPEAIAGALIGTTLVMALAFIPQTASWIDLGSAFLVPLLLIGAAIGAIVSWLIARPKLEQLMEEEAAVERDRRRVA